METKTSININKTAQKIKPKINIVVHKNHPDHILYIYTVEQYDGSKNTYSLWHNGSIMPKTIWKYSNNLTIIPDNETPSNEDFAAAIQKYKNTL